MPKTQKKKILHLKLKNYGRLFFFAIPTEYIRNQDLKIDEYYDLEVAESG